MSESRRHTIPSDVVHQRIDQYLAHVFPDFSRSHIQKLIVGGHVRLNGRVIKSSLRIAGGERIDITPPVESPMELKPEAIPLRVIHEDNSLLIIDKPAGLVVHPAPGHPGGTLVNALLARSLSLSSVAGSLKPGIVHRLDKDTSGLMLIAKDDETHRRLGRQFSDRQVRRVYLCLVHGVISIQDGVISAPIGRNPFHRQQMAVRYGAGREAITAYRVLERFKNATYLELTPQTGRTHQLRVHLAHIGHPILGDPRYGGGTDFQRQALHAHRLGFTHPGSGKWMEFVSDLPSDMQEEIRRFQSIPST